MILYTDGSAHPNPGPGGFGVVILDNEGNFVDCYSEQVDATTNNREELKAILYAMKNFGLDEDQFFPNLVRSDSAYSINTLTNWMFSWERKGWIKSDKKTPENLDLIKEYFALHQIGYRVDFELVKGHSNDKWNDLADALATGRMTTEEVKRLYGSK
jgi:ribonuclease HI